MPLPLAITRFALLPAISVGPNILVGLLPVT